MRILILMSLLLFGTVNASYGQTEKKEGVIIHKFWSKSVESYNAGGSDYFVLCNSDQIKRLPKNGITCSGAYELLKETTEVPASVLEKYVGERVEIEGEMIEPKGPSVVSMESKEYKKYDGQVLIEPGDIKITTLPDGSKHAERMPDIIRLPGGAARFAVKKIHEVGKV